MIWTTHLLVFAFVLNLISAIGASNSNLQFITEPTSRLVQLSDGRAVFRCEASPPGAEIRWLHNGSPIHHNRWIKISGPKLTIHLGKMDNVSKTSHHLDLQDDIFFQCEIRFKGKVLVSAPAKLVVATLDQFPAQPDVHISAIAGNIAAIPCDPPFSVPNVVTEFLFNDTVIRTTQGKMHLMASGDLQIFDVKHEDSGEYICVANNPFLAEKVTSGRKVFLHVTDSTSPKAATIIKSPRSKVSVALGSNITLECAAGGFPKPTVSWRRHHGKLPNDRYQQIGGNLHLIGVKRSDEGVYFCEADNSNGDPESRSVNLEIQETPKIVKSVKSINLDTGENLTLNCQVRGHPKPALKWLHNGRELSTDTKRTHLIIQNVSYRHGGIYQCFASNDLGTVYVSTLVTITSNNDTIIPDERDYEDYDFDLSSHREKDSGFSFDKNSKDEDGGDDRKLEPGRDSSIPYDTENFNKRHKKKHSKGVKLIPPSKPEITRLSNTSVMVRWTVGNGGLPIYFFKVQYKEVGKRKSDWMTIDEDVAAHIHSYAVTNLRTGGAYRFRIAAVYSNNDNKAGPISAKFVLYKDPPMEKPSIGPVITFAEAESPSAITLHWDYNDVDSVPIQGFFIHYRATHTAGKYLKVAVLGSNTRSHTISHLLPETGYDIKMQCFNAAGTSDFSNIYTSKTKASEIVANTRSRNSKTHQDESIDTSNIESVSSKNSSGGIPLYIILGTVLAISCIVVVIILGLFFRRRRSRHENHDDRSDREDPHKIGNGHVSSNGYIAVCNKVNISVNPLSHLDIDSTEKLEDLQDITSNNNEIIRLQTFSVNSGPQAEALLNGAERECSFNESDKASSVIPSCNPESSADVPADL